MSDLCISVFPHAAAQKHNSQSYNLPVGNSRLPAALWVQHWIISVSPTRVELSWVASEEVALDQRGTCVHVFLIVFRLCVPVGLRTESSGLCLFFESSKTSPGLFCVVQYSRKCRVAFCSLVWSSGLWFVQRTGFQEAGWRMCTSASRHKVWLLELFTIWPPCLINCRCDYNLCLNESEMQRFGFIILSLEWKVLCSNEVKLEA